MTPGVRAELRDVAGAEGAAPALARLYMRVGEGAVHCGPRGHAVVPAAVLAAATHVCLDGVRERRTPAAERPLPLHPYPSLGELCAVRVPISGLTCPDFLAGLTWLRFGLSRGLLDATVAYARSRTVAGGPLLHQQLVKGALADAAVELLAVETALAGDPTGVALRELHDQITQVDRALLRLHGARGFVLAGPASPAHLSDLLAGVYVADREVPA
ncbi:acyl-CoA dehydrogenase family protein [Micromonosporaceae bacterium B7E4]